MTSLESSAAEITDKGKSVGGVSSWEVAGDLSPNSVVLRWRKKQDLMRHIFTK